MRILLLGDTLSMRELEMIMEINRKCDSFQEALSIIQLICKREPVSEFFYDNVSYDEMFSLSSSIDMKLRDVIISQEDFNDKELEAC